MKDWRSGGRQIGLGTLCWWEVGMRAWGLNMQQRLPSKGRKDLCGSPLGLIDYEMLNVLVSIPITIVSQKSTHGQCISQVCQRWGWALFWVFLHLTTRVPMSCLQRLDALEANNWTNNNIQRNHQWLQSRFLMAHNTLNSSMSPWAWCSSCTTLAMSVYIKMPLVKYCTKFLTSDMHSAWGCSSQIPGKSLLQGGWVFIRINYEKMGQR